MVREAHPPQRAFVCLFAFRFGVGCDPTTPERWAGHYHGYFGSLAVRSSRSFFFEYTPEEVTDDP
jgi:hypothetical protein